MVWKTMSATNQPGMVAHVYSPGTSGKDYHT